MKLHLVGGFLGSGKTTAIIGAARQLSAHGLRVGVVTNDQGKYLVDTAFFQAAHVPTVEVTGGCFCCNYDDLSARLGQLQASAQPDVVFAESVGSCADLVATVLRPLLALAQGLAPASLSVFADCRLLRRRLTGAEMPFSEDVMYIFDQQIEEAGLLVVSKVDLLPAPALDDLRARVEKRYPGKPVLFHSALPHPVGNNLNHRRHSERSEEPRPTSTLTPKGLSQKSKFVTLALASVSAAKHLMNNVETLRSAQGDIPLLEQPQSGGTRAEGDNTWLSLIESGAVPLPAAALQMDYPRYAAGEARLAWLDMQFDLNCPPGQAGVAVLRLLQGLLQRLGGIQIGHIKLTAQGEDGASVKLSLTAEAQADSQTLPAQVERLRGGQVAVLLNARAECPPEHLRALTLQALADCGAGFTLQRSESFAPGFPNPTHRLTD